MYCQAWQQKRRYNLIIPSSKHLIVLVIVSYDTLPPGHHPH